jgi:hypothetical protein
MGAYARLQTQSITGQEEVHCVGDGLMLKVVGIRPNRRLELYEPCTLEIAVNNQSEDKSFGPVVLSMWDPTGGDAAMPLSRNGNETNALQDLRGGGGGGMVLQGEQEIEIRQIPPGEAVLATMSFLPLQKGRQYLQGVVLTDANDGQVHDRLPAIEVYVH